MEELVKAVRELFGDAMAVQRESQAELRRKGR